MNVNQRNQKMLPCYQRNGKWKAWYGNRTVTRKSSLS